MTDDSNIDELNASMAPRPLPWEHFENEVADHIQKELDFLNLGLAPQTARVVRRPKYFSKSRESTITFDVSIEVWPQQLQKHPTLIWIWECKSYPDRNVKVDEVEEFHSKLVQVGAHKGTIATRTGFATGAIAFAKSHGIGLRTLIKQEGTILLFSQNEGMRKAIEVIDVGFQKELDIQSKHQTIGEAIASDLNEIGLLNWDRS